jgi:hypothetical protein
MSKAGQHVRNRVGMGINYCWPWEKHSGRKQIRIGPGSFKRFCQQNS